VDDEVMRWRKWVDRIGRLQGLWPVGTVEAEEEIDFVPCQLELRIPIEAVMVIQPFTASA
jgi:hypothetical protein